MVSCNWVINMKKVKTLEIPYPNDKYIRIQALKRKGLSNYMINRMVNEKLIKKINGKTYENLLYKGDDSDYLYVYGYVEEGIVCLMSAAVYYGVSTFRMQHIDVAIEQKAKINILPDWPDLKLYYFSNQRYILGIETIKIDGGAFKIYDLEKTVCDLLSYRHKYGLEDALSVLKNYLRRTDKDLNKLIKYAKKLRVYEVLKKYLEVLL